MTKRTLCRSLAIALLTAMTVLAWLAAARANAISTRTSDNWAGYAVTARSPLISVSGAWVQPSAEATATPLSSRGSSFTVSYKPGATIPGPPPLTNRDRLRHDWNLPRRPR
jgi:hypothetical protein